MEKPLEKTKKLSNVVGCPTNDIKLMVECLRSKPARQIVAAVKHFQVGVAMNRRISIDSFTEYISCIIYIFLIDKSIFLQNLQNNNMLDKLFLRFNVRRKKAVIHAMKKLVLEVYRFPFVIVS